MYLANTFLHKTVGKIDIDALLRVGAANSESQEAYNLYFFDRIFFFDE